MPVKSHEVHGLQEDMTIPARLCTGRAIIIRGNDVFAFFPPSHPGLSLRAGVLVLHGV